MYKILHKYLIKIERTLVEASVIFLSKMGYENMRLYTFLRKKKTNLNNKLIVTAAPSRKRVDYHFFPNLRYIYAYITICYKFKYDLNTHI